MCKVQDPFLLNEWYKHLLCVATLRVCPCTAVCRLKKMKRLKIQQTQALEDMVMAVFFWKIHNGAQEESGSLRSTCIASKRDVIGNASARIVQNNLWFGGCGQVSGQFGKTFLLKNVVVKKKIESLQVQSQRFPRAQSKQEKHMLYPLIRCYITQRPPKIQTLVSTTKVGTPFYSKL